MGSVGLASTRTASTAAARTTISVVRVPGARYVLLLSPFPLFLDVPFADCISFRSPSAPARLLSSFLTRRSGLPFFFSS